MRCVLAALVLFLGLAGSAWAVEILHWERLPISVRLLVGQERVILIDRNVRVGVPQAVREQLRVQSTGGALYLKADAPFAPMRLQLQDAETGALVLLDVRAEPAGAGEAALEPIRIVGFSNDAVPASDAEAEGVTEAADATTVKAIPVVLTRYAAQSLYAPLRTIAPVHGLTAVPVRRDLPLETLLPTLPVRASALAAWRLADHWLTAVKLSNSAPRIVELDPRALQGDFVAATFQHPNVGCVGDSTDTTVVYLVTRGHGLAESLMPALAPVDATAHLPLAGIAAP